MMMGTATISDVKLTYEINKIERSRRSLLPQKKARHPILPRVHALLGPRLPYRTKYGLEGMVAKGLEENESAHRRCEKTVAAPKDKRLRLRGLPYHRTRDAWVHKSQPLQDVTTCQPKDKIGPTSSSLVAASFPPMALSLSSSSCATVPRICPA